MTQIWFNLLVLHAGHIYWISSFPTLEECQVVQVQYEQRSEYKDDRFWCPFVRVERTSLPYFQRGRLSAS
jgi:hypothetical protein